MSNIVDSCPLRMLPGGLKAVHTGDDITLQWLKQYAETTYAT